MSDTRVDPLRDYNTFQKSIRNFAGWLGPVVSGGCDIDFVAERKGHFLFIEAKPYESQGIFMGYGQHLLLYRLSKQPHTSVWLVGEAKDSLYWLDYATPIPPKTFRRKGKLLVQWEPHRLGEIEESKEGLRAKVEAWWQAAEEEPAARAA